MATNDVKPRALSTMRKEAEAVAIEFSPGALFKMPAGIDDFAYGVMLSRPPYVAFYHKRSTFDENGMASEPPMFIVGVAKVTYAKGGWGKPIRQLPVNALHPIPRFFWQDPTNKYTCKIVEPAMHRVAAKPAECVGLEAEAAWATQHIQSRITDTYAGRPNIFAESLRVKL